MARRPFDPRLARGGLFDQVRGAAVPGATPPATTPPVAGGPPAAAAAPAPSTAAESAPPADGPQPLTVTQASEIIRRALVATGKHRIVGEVSNFTQRDHWYFTIKDEESQLDCAMWASANARAPFVPGNGMEIVVVGEITHYGRRGRTQLSVQRIERRGMGSLQARFAELCRLLREQGYFDQARKRPLPKFPRRVAVITSAGGAALHDVLRTAALRAPFVRLLVIDVQVQGEGAAEQVAAAIAAVDRRADELGIDAMIVTRGGGSLEDLWAFNERVVADAAFRATTPIVAAIGHEADTTVIELVADHRASTPTQAVMLLFPDREGMEQQVDALTDRLQHGIRRRMHEARRHLESLARHPMFRSPLAPIELRRPGLRQLRLRLESAARARLHASERRFAQAHARLERNRPAVRHANARARVQALHEQLQRSIRATLQQLRAQTDSAERQLRALGPAQVLARGYSLTFDAQGRLLRRAADAAPGDRLRTRLADGTIDSAVERVEQGGDGPAPAR
ncbi:MAG: exodeoxyribonuclease VII large subunit [Phycisphaerales bacterium]